QTRGLTAARERLTVGPQVREVRARTCSGLEDAHLPSQSVCDATVLSQVVVDGEEKTGHPLWALVPGMRLDQLTLLRVEVEALLGGVVDPVRPVQARVEPLGGVGGEVLVKQKPHHLVVEDLGS